MKIEQLESARQIVRRGLIHYALDPDAVIEHVKYRENHVFRVSTAGQSFALRIHRPGYRTDAEINAELDFIESLRTSGVAVSQFVRTSAGETLCVVEDAEGRFQIDLQLWIDGKPLGDVGEAFEGSSGLLPADFGRLGQLMARTHNATDGMDTGPLNRRAWDIDGLVGDSPVWGSPLLLPEIEPEDRATLEAAVQQLRLSLADYGTKPAKFGPIHADFTPENVLVSDQELVLIDFDDFGEGWHLFDIATALLFFKPHPRYAEYQDALLGGYCQHRALDLQDLQMLQPMLLARALTYLGWAAARRGDETAEFIAAELLPLTVGLAREFISQKN